MTVKDFGLALVSLILIGLVGAIVTGMTPVNAGDERPKQLPDSLRDVTLENRMAICGVPDSQIISLMWMRQKQVVSNEGEFNDGRYFYVSPDRRRGWLVTIDHGCLSLERKVFDLDNRVKR